MAVRTFDASNGEKYIINQSFAAQLDQALPEGWPDAHTAEHQRLALLDASNSRELTGAERVKLAALTHLKNMHKSAELLKGRAIEDVFGPGATIDQVHHNSITMPCGCKLNIIFDHNKRNDPSHENIPHYPTSACAEHPVGDDYKEHFARVMAAHAPKPVPKPAPKPVTKPVVGAKRVVRSK